MRKTKKLLLTLLSVACVGLAGLGLASCEDEDARNLINDLQTVMDTNKTELDGKITVLETEYKAKDEEILAKIEKNEQSISTLTDTYESKVAEMSKADEDNAKAIADLTTEYNAKVEELLQADEDNTTALAELRAMYESKLAKLTKADEDNAKAIADLTATYNEKVAELEEEIEGLNAQILANKTELEDKIANLQAVYEAKFDEIQDLIDTVNATDKTQDEKIKELAEKIIELENEKKIIDVEFEENGDLTVYYSDGTTETVASPKEHIHTFGEWEIIFNFGDSCETSFFGRYCAECYILEWKVGTEEDHSWALSTVQPTCTEQGYDIKTCEYCEKEERYNYTESRHTDDGSGVCTECSEVLYFTEGVSYEISSDGTYAVVMGYTGSATRVAIADTYQNVPVTSIGEYAFKNCISLTEIVIPDGVTSIGAGAFCGCISLTAVEIPDTVTSIGNRSFNTCSSLTKLTIPDSVASIGENAFSSCENLTIYCDFASKPTGWDENWKDETCTVVWDNDPGWTQPY